MQQLSRHVGTVVFLIGALVLFAYSQKEQLQVQEPPLFAKKKSLEVPFTQWQREGGADYFHANIANGEVFVSGEGISYLLKGPLPESADKSSQSSGSFEQAMTARLEPLRDNRLESSSFAFREQFAAPLSVVGNDKSSISTTHFQGQQRQHLPTFSSLSLGKPWPDIAVSIKAISKNIEKLFFVHPGGDARSIEITCQGIDGLTTDQTTGELLINTALGQLRMTKPIAYQEIGGMKHQVEVAYNVIDTHRYGFTVGDYTKSETLIIDPLLASTFIGGSGDEHYAYDDFAGHSYVGHPAIVSNSAGDIYVVGHSRSPDYPTTVGVIDATYNDATSVLKNDIVVTRLSADLSTVLASTYLGGSSEDNGASLVLDPVTEDIYVLGFTRSRDFPVMDTGFDPTYGGGNSDAFIAKLSPDLSTLRASTYLGGTDNDFLYGLTIAPDHSLYLVGDTYSSRFPTRAGGYDLTRDGTNDAFVLQMTSDLSTVTKGSLLGGSALDYGRMVSLNSAGSIVVVGNTSSANFPTTLAAYDQTPNGDVDAYIAILSNDLSSLQVSTYIGGSSADSAYSLAINSANEVIIAGATLSSNFPTAALGYEKTHQGGYDGFIARFPADLSALSAMTFVGGSKWEDIYEIRTTTSDEVVIGGWTQSPDLPVGSNSYDTTLGGASDAMLGKYSSDLDSRLSLTYLGGSGNVDYVLSLLLDSGNNVFAYGFTDSADFPIKDGAEATLRGGRDTFVALMSLNLISDSYVDHLLVRDNGGNGTATTSADLPLLIRIEARDDRNAIVLNFSGDKVVTFTGPVVAPNGAVPTCTDKDGVAVAIGLPTTLTFVSGQASCTLRVYKPQNVSLDAAIDDSLSSLADSGYDLDLTVVAGAPAGLESILDVTPKTTVVGSTVSIVLTVQDPYGNPLGSAASGQTVQFSVTGNNPNTPAVTDNGNGTYSGSYVANQVGQDSITGTVNGNPIRQDTDGVSNGVYLLPIQPRPPTRYQVRYQSGPGVYLDNLAASTGGNYTIRITALDSAGDVVSTYSGLFPVAIDGPGMGPDGRSGTCGSLTFGGTANDLSFVNGVATCTANFAKVETVSIDAASPGITSMGSTSDDLDVVVNAQIVDHFRVTGTGTQVAGTSQLVTIAAYDAYENPVLTFAGQKDITLSGPGTSATGNSPTATDKDNALVNIGTATPMIFTGGVATTTVTLYKREQTSIDVTDGTANSFAKPAYDLDVNVSSTATVNASQSSISTSINPAGICGALGIIITAKDSYGNRVENSAQVVVITVAGANSATPAVTNRNDGTYVAQYNPAVAGSDSITATISGSPIGQDTDGVASDGTFQETIIALGVNTVTWEGDISTDWGLAGNWVGDVSPTQCSDVIINGNLGSQPTLNLSGGSVTVNSISLGSSSASTLTVASGDSTHTLATKQNFTIGNSGTLTHSANQLTQTHSLFLDVGGNLNISSNGKIDLNGKGYDYTTGHVGSGPGGGWGDASTGYGAGYGGRGGGGYHGSVEGWVYGSITEPFDLGSAGGSCYNCEGGGAAKIVVAGIISLAGKIRANGRGSGRGGGSGGSIYIITNAISGSGEITATGGAGTQASGGGGRIAVHYSSSLFTGTIEARDGGGGVRGTSGTVFEKGPGETYGTLALHAYFGGGSGLGGTPIDYDITVDKLELWDYAPLYIPENVTFTLLNTEMASNGSWYIGEGGTINAPNLTSFSDGILWFNITNRGIYNHSSSTLELNNCYWIEDGEKKTIGDTQPITDIIVAWGGVMHFRNQSLESQAEFNSIMVYDGGELRGKQSYGDVPVEEMLNIKANIFHLESGGLVFSRGFTVEFGAWANGEGGGNRINDAWSGGGHAGYGGPETAGGDVAEGGGVYGSVTQPTVQGSAGASNGLYVDNSYGGGAVILDISGELLVDGVIDVGSNDVSYSAGGSGGSAYLSAGTFSGSGVVDASGGSTSAGHGGGGGGRIAIYYDNSTFSGDLFASGGNGTEPGGAGTIYLKDSGATNGDLIVDNQGVIGQTTPLMMDLTVQNLTVRNGARLVVEEPYTLNVLANSITTTANASLTIEDGAVVNAPNLSGLNNFNVTNHGIYNHSSGTLVIGSGLSWYEDGVHKGIGNSQGITDLVIDGVLEFWNQNPLSPTTFNSLVIHNGGILRPRGNGDGNIAPVILPQPIAAYNFNEQDGSSVLDSSGNHNDGTIVDGAWNASGRFNSALQFNGSSSLVTVADSSSLDVSAEMTLEGWIYPTGVPGTYHTIILKEMPGGLAYALYYMSDGTVSVYINVSGTEHGLGSNTTVSLNSWTHIAATYDGSDLAIYINGVEDNSRTISGPIATSSEPLRIGGNTIWSEPFEGLIDDVRIYDQALTETQINLDMIVEVGTLPPSSDSEPTTLNLETSTLTIDAGGMIDLNGAGYSADSGNAGAGPGGGAGNGPTGGGGAHGGDGGNDSPSSGGIPYGSVSQPIELGSSGGSCPGLCAGGGAAKLLVTNTLTLNGTIRANGSATAATAGGAGGSIWLDAQTITGSGLVTTNGAASASHGGGGGGRIALYYTLNNFSGSLQSYGAAHGGGAGTIYLKNKAGADMPPGVYLAPDDQGGALVIDNNGYSGGYTPTLTDLNVSSLTLQNNAALSVTSGTTFTLSSSSLTTTNDSFIVVLGHFNAPTLTGLTNLEYLDNYGTITFAPVFTLTDASLAHRNGQTWNNITDLILDNGGMLSLGYFDTTTAFSLNSLRIMSGGMVNHFQNDTLQTHVLNISANTLTIDTGGQIFLRGLGLAGDQGAGKGTGISGAGYGGNGGNGSTGAGGASYGIMSTPLDLGSGGGSGSSGGGAVRLQVAGTLTLNGSINSDGSSDGGDGGGSGGSVYLTAQTLSGDGIITANGGDGVSGGGGGSGGRIAIYVFSQTFIPDGGDITAPGSIIDPIGGMGLNPGADGTLYFSFADHYLVTGLANQVSGSSQVIDLQIIDNYSQPFYWNFTRPVVFSGPGQVNINGTLISPSWADRDSNAVLLGQPTTLDFTDGAASSSMTLYKVESVAVDVTDGTITSFANPSYDLDVTVTAQEATLDLGSDIDATPSVVEVNNNVAVTVTVKDQWGNAKTTGGDAVTLNVSGANPQALVVTDNNDGSYSATYVPTVAGVDLITGTLNTKTITGDLDGLSDGTFYVTITAGVADHFEITGPANVIAGTGYHITIKAISNTGAVDAAYNGDKQITFSGAVAGPLGHLPTCRNFDGQDIPFGSPTTLEFVLGQATCQMRLYRVGATEVDATDGTIGSSGNVNWDLNTTVNNLVAEGVTGRISATPNPVERNYAVTIYVATFDAYGNALSSGGQSVTLQITGVNTVTPAVTDLGDGTYSASYTPTNGGQDLVTGTLSGLVITADTDGTSDGVFHETVTATITPTHLEVTGANSQVAGGAQTITISARDDAGENAFSYNGDKSITLTGPLAAISSTLPTCTDKNGVDVALGTATTLSFTNGQATCSLKLYRAEVTTVDATDGTLSSAANPAWDLDVTVTAGAGVGSESVLSASPSLAEVAATVTVTLQAKDAYGNSKTAAGDTVTFAVAGANPAGSLSVTYIGAGQYQATYAPTATGLDQISSTINTQAVTNDTDGTSDGTYNENIVSYHLEVTGSATQTAGTSQVITISKRRHDGVIDTSYAGDHTLTLSGPLAAPDATVPTCTDKTAADINLGTATTLTFTNGQATCTLKLYRAEVTSVDVTDGTYSSAADTAWDLDITVSAALATGSDSSISAGPNPQESGATVTITVQGIDAYQNPLTTGGDTVTIAVAGANPAASLAVTDLGTGQYQATYVPSVTGQDFITGAINSTAISKDSDGTSDGTFHEDIISYHFEVTGSASQVAGASQVITIVLRRNDGAVLASYAGDHVLTLTGPMASPDGSSPTCRDKSGVDRTLGTATTLTFAGGQSTCLLTLYRAEVTSLDVADANYSSSANASWDLDITVNADASDSGESVISASPNPGIVGGTVTVNVQAKDAYGNFRQTGGDPVTLAVSGANPSGSLSISYIGSGQYQGSYSPAATGLDQITGTINSAAITKDTDGTDDGTFNEDVISYHFEVTGSANQAAGTSQVVTITLKKNDGSTETNYVGDKALTLSGPLAAPDGTLPTCSDKSGADISLGALTTLTFVGGQASCTLKLYRAEVVSLDASDGVYSSTGDASWDLDITVSVAAVDLDESILDATPNPAEINSAISVSVTVRDQFRNLRVSGTDLVTLTVAGDNPQPSLSVTYQGAGVYQGSYTPTLEGEDLISGTINAAVITQDADGISDGVFHEDVVAFHIEVSGSGSQVAGSAQVITISIHGNAGAIDTTYVGDRAITLSGPGNSPSGTIPTCTDKDSVARNLGTPTTLTFVAGQATCTLVLYRQETTAVDASDGTYSSAANPAWDLNVVVSDAVAVGGASIISASPDPQEVGQVVTVNVQAVDAYGNPRTNGGDTVTLAVSGANPNASLAVSDLGNGVYQATYTPSATGEDQITGVVNGAAIQKDTDSTSDGTYHQEIISYHLVVTGSATQTAGDSQVITLAKRRHDGVLDTSYVGDHSLTLSGPLAATDGTQPTCQDRSGIDRNLGTATTLNFVAGIANCTLKLYRAEVTSIDANDGTYSSAADIDWDLDVTVTPAPGHGSESIISASPNPGETGGTITLSVLVRDLYRNTVTSGSEVVSLAVSGANTVPIVAMSHVGGGTYSGTYTPGNSGQDLITGLVNGGSISQDSDGTSDGTYHEDIVAYHLEVSGTGVQIAGSMQVLTITARSHDGSVNTSYLGSQTITLSGPLSAPSGTVPTCTDNLSVARDLGTPTTLTFVNGVGTCELRLYRAETTSIDATDGTFSSYTDPTWDLDVTVSAGLGNPSQSTLAAIPNPGEISHPVALQVTVLDSYQNGTTGGDSIAFNVAGANPQAGLVGTHLGSGVYQCDYIPMNPGEDLITSTVNSATVTRDTDSVSDGIYHETINAFHLEVSGEATQKSGNTQLITISVRDHGGALNTAYTGDHLLTISGPSASANGQAPTCQDRSGVFRPLGTGSTLLFTAGQATCLLALYHAETVAVDATDGTYSSFNDPSWDLDLVVSSQNGGVIEGTLAASPNPTDRGSLTTVEVEASDEYGNDLPEDTIVNAVVSGGNNTALLLVKVAPRLYRGAYPAANAGEDMITASVSAQALTKDSDGVSDGVYHLRVRETRASTHKIRGRVYWHEPAGEPVKGVIVSEGSHTALSNGHGNYELSDVADGVYTISGLYEGYQVRVEAGLNPVSVAGNDVSGIDLVVWREVPLTLYAPWNGFLDNVVINEVFNTGTEDLEVTITLYKMSGSQVGRGSETRVKVKPREQIDVIVNDLNGFEEDRYGVLVIEMNHGSYSGQVSYYKLTPSGSFRTGDELAQDFDYAFPNPFVPPVTGTSWVTFNTHQPSHHLEEKDYLVPNWLTIINGDETTSNYFRIRKYDESGKRIVIPDNTGTVSQICKAAKNELRCRVPALGRIDIDGGHVYPGPERAGLIEIVPEDSSGKYVAGLARYGVNSPPEVYSSRYSFGAYLPARQGQGREQVLAVSTGGEAENWVEIANTLTSRVRAQVEVVGYNGEMLYAKNLKINPHAQVHLNMPEILGENTSGVLRITGDKAGSILAQSASYYLNDERQVVGVSITQHQDTYGRKVYGTYNRYLNTDNWLKVINLNKTKRNVTLVIYRPASEESHTLTLAGYGGFDLPLHDFERFGIAPNTLGMFEIRDSLSSSLSAELSRIKPSSENTIDFSMSTRLR